MKIPQFKPFIGDEELNEIRDCFVDNWITEGPKSEKFVKELNALVGSKYGVLAPNGTLSLYLALKALDIGKGDEVLVPNFSFYASASSIHMAGAKPVFVEVNKNNLQIDVHKIQSKINRKTKAIMPVHIYGMACDMEEIKNISKKNKLKIIEDAAQGIGLKFKNQHVGTFGEIGSFSFFADKTITTTEGGYLCTNDEKIYNKLLFLRNQGRINRGSFIHPEIGYNFRMNDILSSIGLVQLKKLEYIKKSKIEIFKLYSSFLNEKNFFIVKPIKYSQIIPFRVAIVFNDILQKEKTEKKLNEKGIETRTFFYPLNQQPFFKKKSFFKKNNKLESESMYLYKRGICLPCYVGLDKKEIKYISEVINKSVK